MRLAQQSVNQPSVPAATTGWPPSTPMSTSAESLSASATRAARAWASSTYPVPRAILSVILPGSLNTSSSRCIQSA